ncbi:amino acid adenylation domain-containing protein, partial [Bacillus stratosphericus]
MSIFKEQSLFWDKVFDYEDNITHLPHKASSFHHKGIYSEDIINGMLSFENSQRVMELTNSSPMAIYIVMLSGVKCLLYKYTGNENIIVGMPSLQDKNLSSLNEILMIKTKIYKTSSFKEIFKELNMFIKKAAANHNIPFRKMVENLNIQYDDNHLPKINTIISLDNLHTTHFKETTSSDVRFEFYIEDNLIKYRLAYNQGLYDPAFMTRVTNHLNRIFSEILFQPNLEISQMKMISKIEEEQILTKFNQSKINCQENTTIHRLFEHRVISEPDHVAVEHEGKTLTYKELNERANQVARLLRENGMKEEELVGIMLDRSFEMIIGILGILKAGGAYVPIDPDYPEERIQYIISNSNIKKLLTKRNLHEVSFVKKTLYLDEGSYDHMDSSNLTINVLPHHLAYVIYTSGTTGKPKGVMVEHQSVINTLTHLESLYPLGRNDSILLKTNYTFDVSITELFGWFFGQGRLVILKRNFEKEPSKMLNIIREKQITHINFVPTMLKVFLNEVKTIHSNKLSSLKYVFAAGEALPVNLIKQFNDSSLNAILENIYGPTEATIYATQYSTNQDMEEFVNTPIGKPIRNMQAYVINNDNQLQPIGLVGELCLSGQGLARGYLKSPDLTSEKFVENPFISGQRMYRTGDLVRRLSDGNIEYVGRIDHQVKIRGYRIEIGEVETALLDEEVIKEAIVTKYEDVHGNKSLCAYIVGNRNFSLSQLKEKLLEKLPSYMIPSYFVQLEQLPITPNGKVDRKALPSPNEDLHVKSIYMAPRTEIEQALVKAWKDILGIQSLGVLDNFYELGGDSIKSIQVSSILFQLGYKVEMTHLLKYPTIAELSQHVYPITNTIEQGEIKGNASLTPIQSWFFKKNFVDNYFNQAMMLYSFERFDALLLEKLMKKIITHHDALRSVFIRQNNQYEVRIRGNEEGPLFSLELFDLKNVEDVESIIEDKANLIQSSIEIAKGPLVKLGLFQCADGDHLLIVIHHLVVDMVSWRILFEDLATGYKQLKNGKPIHLPPKTDSYKQWSTLLFDYAQGSEIEKERTYWNQIEQVQHLPLPRDHENMIPTNENNHIITVKWNEQETEQLLKKTNKSYNTEINDLLLTALGLAVYKWTGIKDVIVNLEGHGRETILSGLDITRTVGWFTSQYPVILQINPNQSLSNNIKTVKEGLRKIPNKGIGYGILRYLSQKQSGIGKLNPEISFNYLGQFDQDLIRNDLKISSLSSGSIISKQTNRDYVLNINGFVQNGKLSLMIEYSRDQYETKTVEQFAKLYKANLMEIIVHCLRKKDTELTPSDLSLKELKINDLEEVIKKTKHIGKVEDVFELSPMQKGMLFHSDLDSSLYTEQLEFDLCGNLDVDTWVKSLEILMQKYSILRMNIFKGWNDTPLQIIYKYKSCPWIYEDLRTMNKEEFIEAYTVENKTRGFNLEVDTLIRLAVFHTENKTHRIILTFHHILMDGWSISILLKEWLKQYESLMLGKDDRYETNLPPYSRYIKWLSQQDKKTSANYWSNYLANYEEQTTIPYSKSAKPLKKYQSKTVASRINAVLTSQLQQIAHRNQVTMNTVIQALWGILLQKYNRSEDVVFGSIVSGRTEEIPSIENMIGLFINTVPVRVQSEEGMTFTELTRKMSELAILSTPHSTYPLYEIQAQTEQKQNLINHIMVFENYPISQLTKREISNEKTLNVANLRGIEQTNYDFNIVVIPGNELEFIFQFNQNVYDERNVEQISSHFSNLVQQVVLTPDIPLEKLSVISIDEKNKILTDFNDTKTDYPRTKTIQELFEEQVELVPNQIAVSYKDQQLTYKDLNERANKLARMLKAEGVGPDRLVAIMVERSLDMIVGILGILKAGGAYLPIDTDYPENRVRYMIEDSGAELLLSQSNLQSNIPQESKVFYLDEQSSYHQDATNLENKIESTHLAYVIYTSGTTGKPKGVMTLHRNIVRVVKNTNYIDITKDDNVLQLSSYSFDGATFDIFGALLNGAKLIIAPKETMLNISTLADLIKNQRISVMFITTAFFNVLVDLDVNCLSGIRKILFGGEQVSVKHVRKAFQVLGPNKIKHVYGPTESTVFATYYDVEEMQDGELNIPIGKPISNTEIYIVDKFNHLLPIGVEGELCISGDGLARGYLNSLDVTKEKFIENPYNSGECMYRTGDLARWLPDGNIEYLGRVDHQVKIRGYRIEIGEVETALLNIKEVQEAIVIADKDGNDEKALCAYFVAEHPYPIRELKDRLSELLPSYMIPAFFVQMEKMPLTPNGKIDRNSLAKQKKQLHTENEFVVSRNSVEEGLVDIWREILGVERVGVKDNFFDIGGHSLRATNLAAKINKKFKVDISLREIFSDPTIEQLATIIENREQKDCILIPYVEEKEYYPVSSAQKRMYILNQREGSKLSYNIPNMLVIDGDLNVAKLQSALVKLIERHESLRTSFKLVQGELSQYIYPNVNFKLKVKKINQHEIDAYARKFIIPFDLAKAPLFRVELLKVRPQKHILLIDIHHIISDGISMNVFMQDLFKLYKGDDLPVLPIQYKDFTIWKEKEFDQPYIKKQKSYWLETLSGELPVLQIPTDFARPSIQDFNGGIVEFEIDEHTSNALRDLAARTDTTLYMVLLAIYTMMLSKYSNQTDIIVGSPIAGRLNSDLDRVIGMFVNTLAMRNYPEGEKSFTNYLMEVKENTLNAFENQDYPFEELVDNLNFPRDMSRSAIFSVMFAMQNIEQNFETIENLNFTPTKLDYHISKFDLTLTAIEQNMKIHCMFEYATSLFREQSIKLMEKHFKQLVNQVISSPDKKLVSISMNVKEDNEQILDKFNNTRTNYPRNQVIQELFEEQVKRTPDQIAVVCDDKYQTYKELNKKANQLARTLEAEGVGPDHLVGIMAESSLDMIVGVLGI